MKLRLVRGPQYAKCVKLNSMSLGINQGSEAILPHCFTSLSLALSRIVSGSSLRIRLTPEPSMHFITDVCAPDA